MKIATYNLLRGGAGLTHWSRMVCEHEVDLLLVQESFAPSRHDKPLIEAARENRSVWGAVPGYEWGSGIYSSSGVLTAVPVQGFEGWCSAAQLSESIWNFGKCSLLVVSIHAPSIKGVSYARLVNQILDEILVIRSDHAVILGGDFNLTVSERHPSETQKLSNTDRQIQSRLRDEFGLINCWQAANPNVPLQQTLRWQKDPLPPFHCDGIFIPREWEDRLEACEIHYDEEWRVLSDHNPVIATIRK